MPHQLVQKEKKNVTKKNSKVVENKRSYLHNGRVALCPTKESIVFHYLSSLTQMLLPCSFLCNRILYFSKDNKNKLCNGVTAEYIDCN
jgi:hypothetical protein